MDEINKKPEPNTKSDDESSIPKVRNIKKIVVASLVVAAFIAVIATSLAIHSKDSSRVKDLNSQVAANNQQILELKDSNKKLADTYNDLKVTNTKLEESNANLAKQATVNAAAKAITPEPEIKDTSCGEPQLSENGGPLLGHVKTNYIELFSGVWTPQHIDIKVGDTVTWALNLEGDIPKMAVESDSGSCEQFSSPDLPSHARFTHTFNKPGVFGWHDKYTGSRSGQTISVFPQ